ncbi:MAG: inorganic pyrophosphatase [Candidatus Omnitrophota bacterium]|nr:inorganic pyrophosphatase [Candidatus Omnitrophota bacterium]
MNNDLKELWQSLALVLRAHPWHGIPIGPESPQVVSAYIETVPTDTVKYEIDKRSGFLKIDRPQKYSSICPTLYGFIPQTYCGSHIAKLCQERTGRPNIVGDDDPLDICVLTEKDVSHGDVMVRATPIGGFCMIDQGQADDKIIAVMHTDGLYSQWKDISDCPRAFIDRLKHYFLTYKDLPGSDERLCEITHIYNREQALEVIRKARQDYLEKYSRLDAMMNERMED